LPRWFDLAWEFSPPMHTPNRAMLWSPAAHRVSDLALEEVETLVDRWLTETVYEQPWQLRVDLVCLGPLLTTASGRK
jgi:hypothetical protein